MIVNIIRELIKIMLYVIKRAKVKMKIKIIKCSSPTVSYHDRIGEVIDIDRVDTYQYVYIYSLRSKNGVTFLLKSDCEIVDEGSSDKGPCTDEFMRIDRIHAIKKKPKKLTSKNIKRIKIKAIIRFLKNKIKRNG